MQCGLCRATCPERVITLRPQLDFRAATASARVLKEEEPFVCIRCGKRFASRMHIDDLKTILPQLGFDYRLREGTHTWQELCPACKRRSLSLAQLRLKEESRG